MGNDNTNTSGVSGMGSMPMSTPPTPTTGLGETTSTPLTGGVVTPEPGTTTTMPSASMPETPEPVVTTTPDLETGATTNAPTAPVAPTAPMAGENPVDGTGSMGGNSAA